MSKQVWTFVVAALATMLMVGTTSAADAQKTRTQKTPTSSHNASAKSARMETITVEIRGAETPESAKALSDALASHNVNVPIEASKGQSVRATASIDRTTDLGSCGEAVASASTSGNKSTAPPSLDLVLFGKFTSDSAKKVSDVLAKVKGVDAQHSKVDATTGELTVRIAGGAKVTADQIHRALSQAGFQAQFTKSSNARTS